MASKSTDKNIVKGKTSSGIPYSLDKRVKEDARFLLYLSMMQDENASVAEKSQAITDMFMLIFGSRQGVIEFMNAVASVNGGVCNTEQMIAELTEMFEALSAKNS
jgi:hypothetical protein